MKKKISGPANVQAEILLDSETPEKLKLIMRGYKNTYLKETPGLTLRLKILNNENSGFLGANDIYGEAFYAEAAAWNRTHNNGYREFDTYFTIGYFIDMFQAVSPYY